MLLVKPSYPFIPPHIECYQTFLPCALCDLFVHSKILYFVSCFCKSALPLVHVAGLFIGRFCPGLSLFPPSACSFRPLPAFSLGVGFARSISSDPLFPPSLGTFLWFPCWSAVISPCFPTQFCSPSHLHAVDASPFQLWISVFKEEYSGTFFFSSKFLSPL